MSKDQSLLESVSKYFTEDTLRDIVAKAYHENSKNVRVLSWDFGSASKKGDSYLSTVDRIVVQCEVNDETKELKVVVKSLPNNVGMRKTYRCAEFFRNEIVFYTEIAPKFLDFIKSKNQSSLLILPDCLACRLDGDNDFIALEDVCPRGFGPVTRQNCLSFDECSCILKAMARFHAISFAYKDQYKDDFEKMAAKLAETYFTNDLYDTWYKRFFTKLTNVAKDALAKEYPGSDAERKFNSYADGELYKKSAEFCLRTNRASSVINQGDSWAPNFLTRLDPTTSQIEVLMLDFQLARCCSPVLDISFLVYSCTDAALREERFDDLLIVYHDELTRVINALGSDAGKIYLREAFLKEVAEQFVHGMVFGLESVTFSTLSDEELFDMDVIKDEKVDIADVWTVKNKKTTESRRRLADIIVHATSRGFL